MLDFNRFFKNLPVYFKTKTKKEKELVKINFSIFPPPKYLDHCDLRKASYLPRIGMCNVRRRRLELLFQQSQYNWNRNTTKRNSKFIFGHCRLSSISIVFLNKKFSNHVKFFTLNFFVSLHKYLHNTSENFKDTIFCVISRILCTYKSSGGK